MRISSSLRMMAVALAMSLGAGTLTAAFAADGKAVQQQAQSPQVQRHPVTNASPYDGPDFVVPGNDINS